MFKASYQEIYTNFNLWINQVQPNSTQDLTKCIKDFFAKEFPQNYVLFGTNPSEFLLDVLVTNFEPKKILKDRSADIEIKNPKIFLAVESELGGEGATSPYGVHKNVVEDFMKLLLVDAPFKILFFTSLPYKGEKDHLKHRVATLRKLYLKSSKTPNGILLIHLEGSQAKKSAQVKASYQALSAFAISPKGYSYKLL